VTSKYPKTIAGRVATIETMLGVTGPARTPAGKILEDDAALARLMEAGARLAQYENGDFPDPKVTYRQIVAEYLAALDGAKDGAKDE